MAVTAVIAVLVAVMVTLAGRDVPSPGASSIPPASAVTGAGPAVASGSTTVATSSAATAPSGTPSTAVTAAPVPSAPEVANPVASPSSWSGTKPEGTGPATGSGPELGEKTSKSLDQAGLDLADGLVEIEENAFVRDEGPPPKEEAPPEPEAPPAVPGQVYTWQDGDRTRQVRLQLELVVVADTSDVAEGDIVGRSAGGGSIVKGTVETVTGGQPTFRSESGLLMSLPGGVVLVLDPGWDTSETDAFFANNGIARHRVSALGELPNAFVIETEPGLPSLDLANALASQEGVEVSSPNWWMETATK